MAEITPKVEAIRSLMAVKTFIFIAFFPHIVPLIDQHPGAAERLLFRVVEWLRRRADSHRPTRRPDSHPLSGGRHHLFAGQKLFRFGIVFTRLRARAGW